MSPFADHNAMLDPSCPDITGRVMEALSKHGIEPNHPAMRRGVRYLVRAQEQDGSWYGRWGVNYIYGTFLALRGLRSSGVDENEPFVQYSLEFIRAFQNRDGGWGESCASYDENRYVNNPSTPSQTAWAILALLAGGDVRSESLYNGIEYLVSHQRSDGNWEEDYCTGTGFPRVFYLAYTDYRNTFPLLALSEFRKAPVPPTATPCKIRADNSEANPPASPGQYTQTPQTCSCLSVSIVPAVLVTGASGFLGWHVARLLIERGHHVRALCRSTSQIRELDVERVMGDLRDPASLQRAAQGCSQVFHVAADYRLWSKNPQDLYQSNVEGTRHLLAAATHAERIVYTSTVGCIGMPPGQSGDEFTPVSIADMTGHYKRSKWLAEQVALEAARTGQPVVIVNPTAPIGDHDTKPTPTGKIIVDFLAGNSPPLSTPDSIWWTCTMSPSATCKPQKRAAPANAISWVVRT